MDDDDAAHAPTGASPASSPPSSPELGPERVAARDEQNKVEEQEQEPEHLICPISRCMFRDPVFVPGSGNT